MIETCAWVFALFIVLLLCLSVNLMMDIVSLEKRMDHIEHLYTIEHTKVVTNEQIR